MAGVNVEMPHDEKGDEAVATLPDDTFMRLARSVWCYFCQFFLGTAGVCFLFAGVICFFAFNWDAIAAFEKFAIIIACIFVFTAVAVMRGIDTFAGGMGVLGAGLFIGPLMAVYGQVYQTGADAWELFFTWACVLLPIAIISLRASLWIIFWVVASLALCLYCETFISSWEDPQLIVTIIFLVELAFGVMWEIGSYYTDRPHFAFFRNRLPVYIITGALIFTGLSFLTVMLFDSLDEDFVIFATVSIVSYIIFLILSATWFRHKQVDVFMMAAGLASVFYLGGALLTKLLGRHLDVSFFFILGLYVMCSALCFGLFFRAELRKNGSSRKVKAFWKSMRSALISKALLIRVSPYPYEHSDTTQELHWVVRVLVAFGVWVAALFFCGWIAILSRESTLGLGILMLGGSFFLALSTAFVSQQLSIVSYFCSLALITYNFLEWHFNEFTLIPIILLCAVCMLFHKQPLVRGISAMACMCSVPYWLYLLIEHVILFDTRSQSFVTVIKWVNAVVYGCVGIVFTKLWLAAEATPVDSPLKQKLTRISLGCLAGLCTILFFATVSRFISTGELSLCVLMSGAAPLAGLAYLIWHLYRQLELPRPYMIAMYIVLALLAYYLVYIGWIGMVLLGVLLARYRSMPLIVTFMSVYGGVLSAYWYYSLSSTLLLKSYVLMSSGVIFIAAAIGLHIILTRAQPDGHLLSKRELLAWQEE